MDVAAVLLFALAVGTATHWAAGTREWWTKMCDRCGRTLEAEGFHGLRSWFATEGIASVVAARNGWSRDGLCPTCRRSLEEE